MSDAIESFNVKGLDQLLKAIKEKPPGCRVGILGKSNNRSDQKAGIVLHNADIGMIHEMGSIKRKIPPRSFLRVPVSEGLMREVESRQLLDENVLKDVIKEGSTRPWLEEVAVAAVAVVADAFESGGGGKWPPHAPGYTNNTGQLLIDTQQLRNAVTHEVK